MSPFKRGCSCFLSPNPRLPLPSDTVLSTSCLEGFAAGFLLTHISAYGLFVNNNNLKSGFVARTVCWTVLGIFYTLSHCILPFLAMMSVNTSNLGIFILEWRKLQL